MDESLIIVEELLGKDFINKINSIAVEAGKKIMFIYQKDFEIQEKPDQSPLTEADLASHNYICEKLSVLTPKIPILSEESANISWEERKLWETYWLIDPLDGTKEFIKKNGEFTVNIALISKGKPVFGVVYAPDLDTLYFGSNLLGAFKEKEGRSEPITIASSPSDSVKVVGSRSHQSDEMHKYLTKFESYDLIPMGSSLKICLIAEGQADIYPRLGPTSEWDTAAAHAVLAAAGGSCFLYDSGQELVYNTKESLLNPYFIAQGPQL